MTPAPSTRARFAFVVDVGTDLVVRTFTLPDGDQNQAYGDPSTEGSTTFELSADRGTEPYTWTIVDGAGRLPNGMTLSSEGVLSGTPTEAGLFAFLVQVADTQLRTDTQPLSLRINAPPEPIGSSDGCSCVTSKEDEMQTPWMSLAVLGMIGAFFGLRRRKRLLGLFAGLLVLGATSSASAQFMQVSGTPYSMQRETITFSSLSSCTTLSTQSFGSTFQVQLPFPFKFYDRDETQVRISTNGGLAFGTQTLSTSSNRPLNSTATPNGWIAAFSDWVTVESSRMSLLCHTTLGNAPDRQFVVEWRNVWDLFETSGRISMKIVLHEGLRRSHGHRVFGRDGHVLVVVHDGHGRPDRRSRDLLCAVGLHGLQPDRHERGGQHSDHPPSGPGVEAVAQTITPAAVRLSGGVDSGTSHHRQPAQQSDRAVLGDHRGLVDPRFRLGYADRYARRIILNPFESRSIVVDTTPPISLGVGSIYMRAVVDSNDDLAEAIETNNTVASAEPTRMLVGAPDISVERVVVVGDAFNSGDSADVVTVIRNVGGDPASNVPVRIALSANPVISRQDVELGMLSVTLAPGETVTTTTTVVIPEATNSGTYFLGALADPDDNLLELNDTNNARASLNTVTVTGASLAITTDRLPRATVRVRYTALIEAVGLGSEATWSIPPMQLPDGVGINPRTGAIFGRPITAETAVFTVTVESNGQTASKELTLLVEDPDEPLTIVTRALPQAVVGQEYSFEVLATGAEVEDQTWTAMNLPMGFSISDNGIIGGTGATAGTTDVTFEVMANGETAQRVIPLEILENPNLLIVPDALDPATFNQPYTAQLQAQGGTEPYTWILDSGSLPPGMNLSPTGEISGTPTQVGSFRIVVEARDSAPGIRAARDINAFVLQVLDDGGLSIATETLPTAVLDEGYDVSIAASGGQPPYDWALVSGRLPEGLIQQVDPNTGEFRIRGQPTEFGITNLLLVVEDSQRRRAQRAFALEVIEQTITPGGNNNGGSGGDDGCTCTNSPASGAASAGLLALGLIGLVFLRRRS